MIFAWELDINFEYNGKPYKCKVDKMVIPGHRPEKFYRISDKRGNRDIIKHEGQWIVCNGFTLDEAILDSIGAAIEKKLSEGI